jgi:hypothetical protein
MRWKRSRRSGPRFGRVLLLTLLLAMAAGYALYRVRPLPLPWHDVGSGRILTPPMDVAGESNRRAWQLLTGESYFSATSAALALTCRSEQMPAGEIHVLTRIPPFPSAGTPAVRVTARLGLGGEVVHESSGSLAPPARTSRTLDEHEAEAFRSLLLDGGYLRMTSQVAVGICDGELLTLETCIHGRYFGVVRQCETNEEPTLQPLAAAVEAFALGATQPPP